MEFERAYDSLWKEGLLIKIYELGIRDRRFNWIFLINRIVPLQINGESLKTVETENGTPQGSIIGPVLFNIRTNYVFENVWRWDGMRILNVIICR